MYYYGGYQGYGSGCCGYGQGGYGYGAGYGAAIILVLFISTPVPSALASIAMP